MKEKRKTLGTNVNNDIYYRVKQYIASRPHMSVSDFVKEAVKEKLEQDVNDNNILLEVLTEVKRLLNRLDTRQTYSQEAFALFIESFFANNPKLPETIKETITKQSKERTELFFKILARRLQSGQSALGKMLMQFIEEQSG